MKCVLYAETTASPQTSNYTKLCAANSSYVKQITKN